MAKFEPCPDCVPDSLILTSCPPQQPYICDTCGGGNLKIQPLQPILSTLSRKRAMTTADALTVLGRIRDLHRPLEVCSECGLQGCHHVYVAIDRPEDVPPTMTVCALCHNYMAFITAPVTGERQQWPCPTMAVILGAEEVAAQR